MRILLVSLTLIALLGCATTDGQLEEAGYNASYIQGFHDGRHSGMKEQGNYLEHFIRDEAAFADNDDYRQGWLAGEEEGKRIQAQADAAVGASQAADIQREVKRQTDMDKVARDAVKNVDTTGLDALGDK